jgi:secreted trypsin-like serine protease
VLVPHDLRKRFVLYKKIVSAAAAAAAVAVAAVPGTAQAVIGGTPDQHDYKFIAALVFKKEAIQEQKDKVDCALTLVDQRWAVVPASCVTRFPGDDLPFDDPNAFVVRFGSTDYTAGESRNVTKIVTNPAWSDAAAQNNIAMVELDQPVQLDQDEFPTIGEPDPTKPVVQVGWGRTIADKRDNPQHLRQATERLLQNTDSRCVIGNSQGVKRPISMDDQYTCAAVDPVLGNGIACYGDSGGQALQFDDAGKPVVISANVAGGCSSNGRTPDIGVKLSRYQDWITSMISTT